MSFNVRFPCEKVPEDAREARLLGLYPQRQHGLYMQRVKVPGGRIDSAQLRAAGEIALDHTPAYPLHLTTRQDIEFHGVRPEQVAQVQRRLAKAGLSSLGACGDTPRNLVECPGAGLCEGTVDTHALMEKVRAAADALPWVRDLPRKFKISFSGCDKACARPWIQDLGIVANADGSFRAILAGSLGPRPGTGVELYPKLSAREVPALALAALRLFHAEGNRENRSRARLRHVRERLGEDEFRRRIDELFREERARVGAQEEQAVVARKDKPLRAHLRCPLGDLSGEEAVALTEAAQKAGALIRIGLEHDILLYGDKEIQLGAQLSRLAGAPRCVSCPGKTWCRWGLADSRRAQAEILETPGEKDGLLVAVSGCPNDCAQAAVADIGLVGRLRRVGAETVEGFKLLAGGGKGSAPELGKELCSFVPADEVAEVVTRLVDGYATGKAKGETLAEFLATEGEELVKELTTDAGEVRPRH